MRTEAIKNDRNEWKKMANVFFCPFVHKAPVNAVISKTRIHNKKKKSRLFFFPPFYKCFSSAYKLDVWLTEHSLQLLFPALRLRDPKLDHILLMRSS